MNNKTIKKYIYLLYKLVIKIKNHYSKFSRKSYSQFGEDLVLSTFVNTTKRGFYLDIGAYHPFKFSNTYFYYKKGWSGINIDAKPGSMAIFKKKRNRDINLEIGIFDDEKELNFYVFKESAYNTFSKDLADSYTNQGLQYDKTVIVKTRRIENVLDQYLPDNKKIDFMSVDVEGLELIVLESNNWDKYHPSYILVEMHNVNIDNVQKSEIFRFLVKKNYKLVSVVFITLIFKYESRV